jgi:hypothetical protein
MRFIAIYKTTETGVPPTPAKMEEMNKFIEEISRAGVLLETGGCLPSVAGARVRRSDGKLTVTDGPFTESKELVAGYALLQTKSRDEAIEWTKRFLKVAGDGESEVRQLLEAGECAGQAETKVRAAS